MSLYSSVFRASTKEELSNMPTSEIDIKQDYQSITLNPACVEELASRGETIEPLKCYSDTVFHINKKLNRTKLTVMVTQHSISFFNMRKSKLMKLYLLKSLKGVTISANNYTLCVLQFENQADILIDSYRRLGLVSYMSQMFKANEYPRFEISVRKRFVLKID